MNSLKINIPKGFVIDKFDENTGEVTFKETPKVITERIKSFEDILLEKGICNLLFSKDYNHLSKDEIAYRKIKLICQVLNEEWTPDWSNTSQYKYYPWFIMGSPSGVSFSYYDYDISGTYSSVGSRLCFKSRNLAEFAGKLFQDIYKDFLTLEN